MREKLDAPARAERARGAAGARRRAGERRRWIPTRPLWQFHLIERYEGGSALIVRIHHCIGDGIALISVMMSITDGGSDPPRASARATTATPTAATGSSDAVLKPLDRPRGQGDAACTASGVARSMELLAAPAAGARRIDRVARVPAPRCCGDVAALALMADDSPTLLKGKPSGSKRVAWGEPMPLDDVKAIGKALGCSINDVLLACVAGAIGD